MVCNVWFEWLSFRTHSALLRAPNNPRSRNAGAGGRSLFGTGQAGQTLMRNPLFNSGSLLEFIPYIDAGQ